MKHTLDTPWTTAGAVVAIALAIAPASLAEVRSCTLGIDINCPSGLVE